MQAIELISRLKDIVRTSGNFNVEISIEANDGWSTRKIEGVSVVGEKGKDKTIWIKS